MALFRSSNPAFTRISRAEDGIATREEDRATYKGIAWKSIYFIMLTFLSAVGSFLLPILLQFEMNFNTYMTLLIISSVVALIMGFVSAFSPGASKICGTIYAVAEGFVVGFVSLVYFISSVEAGGTGGEVFAALFATIGVAAGMMILYATGVIRVGSGFRKFMISALVGMIIMGLVMLIISLMDPMLGQIFYGYGPFSIMLSVFMVIFASLMILLDLNRMTEIVENGMDKKYEWYAAFGLLLTLVWLYMEFLKLFAKLSKYFQR